jgi:ferric-dicitrate binding protein FerR (iron transport regulator)
MEVSDQLIEQFFSGGGTEDEKRRVKEFLKNNPGKLDQYLTEQGWQNFNADSPDVPVPTHRLRRAIEKRLGRSPVKRMNYAWMAAAATVSLVCLVVYFRSATGGKGEKNTMPDSKTVAQTTIKEEKISQVRSITNESSKARIYFLPDGSHVELGGHSGVSFNQPFTGNRRDIFLKGYAVFSVMKNRLMPFAVHSRSIVTTALGTVFGVNSKSSRYTTVHLFSGRVVIKKENPDAGKTFKDIYLRPGQKLILNNEAFSVQIKTDAPRVSETREEAGPLQPQVLKFTRQSLAEIFSILNKEYKTKIVYNPAGMKNLDFTGSFDRNKETLESFLNTLCILNELKLKKTNISSFSISEK